MKVICYTSIDYCPPLLDGKGGDSIYFALYTINFGIKDCIANKNAEKAGIYL